MKSFFFLNKKRFFSDLKLVAYFCVCRRSTTVSPCSGSGWWLSPPTWVHPCRCWKRRRVGEVLPEELSGEKLLTRLLMDSRCLPVRSETPLFTSSSAHVSELNRGRGVAFVSNGRFGRLPPVPVHHRHVLYVVGWDLSILELWTHLWRQTSGYWLYLLVRGMCTNKLLKMVVHCFVFLYCM